MSFASASRQAFTLIELLVVIAIIITLMGLLIAVANTNQAEIAATVSKIKSVEGSIMAYKTQNGKLPLQSLAASDFSDSDTDIIASRNHELRARLVAQGSEFDVGGEHAFEFEDTYTYKTPSVSVLSTVPTNIMYCITDAWDNPIVYKPYTAYLSVTGAPKRDTFQIWSPGPDGEYNMNSSGPGKNADVESDSYVHLDDITNWGN